MINVVCRGERGPGLHWQDVTRLRCYCADHTPLEIIQEGEGESILQLHQARRGSSVLSSEAIVLQAGYIFYLYMIIRYEEIFIKWTIFGDWFCKAPALEAEFPILFTNFSNDGINRTVVNAIKCK